MLGTALVEDTAQQISNCPWVQGSVGRHHRPTSFLPWGCFNGTGPFFSIPIAAHVQCNGCWQTASVSAFHCLGCGYTDYLRSACWMVLHSQSCVQLCDICFFSPPPPPPPLAPFCHYPRSEWLDGVPLFCVLLQVDDAPHNQDKQRMVWWQRPQSGRRNGVEGAAVLFSKVKSSIFTGPSPVWTTTVCFHGYWFPM